MKKTFSKKIQPHIFQREQLSALDKHNQAISKRARSFLSKATVAITSCCLCQSTELNPFLSVFGYEYVQCARCTHVMLRHRLSKEAVTEFYNQSSDYARTYTNKEQIHYRLKEIATPKVKFVMETISRKKGTWLDVGSAIGDVPVAVEQYTGWKALGLDVSKDSIMVGKKILKAPLLLQELKEYYRQHQNKKYDVVSGFGYYALIPDPLEELTIASSMLHDNGFLVIGESNAHSVSTLLQQSYPELTMRHLVPPNTLHEFTLDSLKFILKKLHFEIKAVWTFGLDFHELLKYLVLRDKVLTETPVLKYLTENANSFQHVIDKDGMGDYLLVVAQKKKSTRRQS